jgi:hypothetical protein
LSSHLCLVVPSGLFPTKILCVFLFFLMCATSQPPWLDHSNYTWRRVQVSSSSLCSFLQPPITSILFSPNILLSTLFSNTLSLCSSLNVRDQVLHTYKSQAKLLFFIF